MRRRTIVPSASEASKAQGRLRQRDDRHAEDRAVVDTLTAREHRHRHRRTTRTHHRRPRRRSRTRKLATAHGEARARTGASNDAHAARVSPLVSDSGGLSVPRRIGSVAAHVDILGDGGYAVAPHQSAASTQADTRANARAAISGQPVERGSPSCPHGSPSWPTVASTLEQTQGQTATPTDRSA
jgi:hypothetical protein